MIVCRILLELPDRPGSLGQVTTLLGRLGADIRQVLVLGRDGEAATDELTVTIPGEVIYRSLAQLLEEIPEVRVLSVDSVPEPALT